MLPLQRELYAVAGPPDTEALKAAYQKHVDDAQEMVDYYREMIAHPERGGIFFGDPAKELAHRKASLEEALEELAWRQELLDGLEAGVGLLMQNAESSYKGDR